MFDKSNILWNLQFMEYFQGIAKAWGVFIKSSILFIYI